MPLNWDMTKVEDVEGLHESDMEWAISESVIWATISLDLSKIDEDNLDEWEWRLAVFQKLHGSFMRKNGKPYYLLREHVERRIGLRVNVSNVKRNDWIRKLVKNIRISDVASSQKYNNEEASK
jgi:virulence-associated protein VapD